MARCLSLAHHGLCSLRSIRNALEESASFSSLPLGVDQRVNQGKEVWADGSDTETTLEKKEGRDNTELVLKKQLL